MTDIPDLDPGFDVADRCRHEAERAFDELPDDDKEALADLVAVEDAEQRIEPHDDEDGVPHLTEDEWAYIAEVTGG
jgi:hypothetical protein